MNDPVRLGARSTTVQGPTEEQESDMRIHHCILVNLVTCLAMSFARWTRSMSDRRLARFLWLVRLFIRDPETRAGLDDLRDILLAGPPGTLVLRKMLADSRREEIRDLVRGVLFFEELDPASLLE